MGYSTSFTGQFQLSGPLSLARQKTLASQRQRLFSENYDDKPDSQCQWVLSADHLNLEWDGQEKFRWWREWLQWIVDEILAPEGITLSGEVDCQGEDALDCSVITVVNGRIWILE